MIVTLFITVIVEGMLILIYCYWRRRPFRPILLTSIFANLITQSLLWLALNIFFQHYLLTLFASEILIWFIESALLYSVPVNQLRFPDAILLSLGMNLASFALGWLMPV